MADTTTADRPLRSDARRNRERILAAANETFARYGADAQMDDIARAAKVGVGTVYRHFPTKDALMGELIRLKFEASTELARRQLEVEDPWEAFAGFVIANTDRMAEDQAQQHMIWFATDAAFEVAGPALAGLRKETAKLIARADKAGVLRKDFTIDDVRTLMCSLGGAMQLRPVGPMKADWRKLREHLLDGLRAG